MSPAWMAASASEVSWVTAATSSLTLIAAFLSRPGRSAHIGKDVRVRCAHVGEDVRVCTRLLTVEPAVMLFLGLPLDKALCMDVRVYTGLAAACSAVLRRSADEKASFPTFNTSCSGNQLLTTWRCLFSILRMSLFMPILPLSRA